MVLMTCAYACHAAQQPETEHTVSVSKLETWLDGGCKSPNEQVVKFAARGSTGSAACQPC
jgi:hypothetical protein